MCIVGLVGRERECERLVDAVCAAAGGRGDLVVVEGPAGIGKTALLRWLADRCHRDGVCLVAARATELGREVSFGLVRRLLEPQVGAEPSLLEAGWARRARPVFAGDAPGDGVAAPLIEGLLALVAELMRRRGPVVFGVDDAQWADRGSRLFLTELAERCPELGCALVLAVRRGPTGDDHPELARIGALAGDGGIIAPGPLSAAAIAHLAGERLAGAAPDLAQRLAATTGGNPLLVTALLEAAAQDDGALLGVPVGVRRLVLSRLDAVGAEARALALAVAILGDGPLRRAADLAGLEAAAADVAADTLIARHVLAAGEPLHFAQPIVAEALLQTLSPFDRSARHRRAAELLDADGAAAERVAAHLIRSRPASDAWVADTLRRAARAALGQGDPPAAVRLLERAVNEPPPPEVRGEVLLELARAEAAAGSPAAISAFEHALEQVRDQRRRADAWHGLSRLLYVRGEHRLAATAAVTGRAELAEGDPRRERLLADELAAALFVPELAAETVARTDALARGPRPSDPALLAHVIVHRSWRGIEPHQLVELAEAAVAADPLVDPESGGFGLSFVAGALNMVDETPRAGELLDAGLERVAERGDPLAEVSLRCCRAWTHIHRGDLAAARRHLDAVRSLNRLGWSAVEGLCGPPLVRLLVELGDLEGAREALARTPPGVHNPGLAWFAGIIDAAAGDHAAALAAFRRAGEELESLALGNPGVLPWRSSAAVAAAQLGLRAEAQALLAPELRQAEALGIPRALGVALRAAGFVADDLALVERSVDVLEQSPAELELARSLLWLGIGYRRARRLRDARAPLGRALDLARELGAVTVAERALSELRAVGARPRRRPRTGLEALTPSERNVAELAATGRTTRQIAAALFLTPKTVETHLTRVFRKLQITSRSELAPLLAEPADAETVPLA